MDFCLFSNLSSITCLENTIFSIVIDKLFQCLCLGGIKGCNENVAGTVAQELIDQAVSAFPFPEDIVDYIKTSKEFIISSLKGDTN